MRRYRNARNWQGIPAALACALATWTPAQAQDGPAPPIWQPVDASLGEVTPVTDFQGLVLMFPDSASARRRLLNAYLEAERPADALNEAVELVRRGYVFSPGAREMLLTLDPTPEQRETLALQERTSTIESSRVLATIPAEVRLVESIWADPRTGDLFVTSVVSRALHVRRGGEGDWQAVPLDGAGSLSGLAYDGGSQLLWVASGVFDQTPDPATAFRGLIAIDPASGEEKRRIAAPEGGSPSDIVANADGTIYASDPLSGAVFWARSGAPTLQTLIAPGTFRSPQGIVAFADSPQIVVSDYAYGLALVDVESGNVRRITADVTDLLDGIDGLWSAGDRLVGIQNGMRPMRIVALTLSPDRTRVVASAHLERAHPAWTEPVGGSISGASLVYVASGQWDRFGDGGALTGNRPPAPTEIRVLSLPAK